VTDLSTGRNYHRRYIILYFASLRIYLFVITTIAYSERPYYDNFASAPRLHWFKVKSNEPTFMVLSYVDFSYGCDSIGQWDYFEPIVVIVLDC
jgi:hypothetical protein